MKKNNLKRFLASLLAVLMLASATGVSPAVFAEDDNGIATHESVQPVLKASGEVVLKPGMSDSEVKAALANQLLENPGEVNAQSLEWTYTCAVKGKYKAVTTQDTKEARAANVSVFGETYVDKNYVYGSFWGKDLTAEATYTYPALQNNNDGEYTLYLNGQSIQVTKVAKLSTSVDFTAADIRVPFNDDGTINYAQLKERIIEKVVTTPADLDRSSIVLTYEASADLSDFGDNKLIDKIAELAGKEWVPIDGGTVPLDLKVTTVDVPYFAMDVGENKIKLSWAGDDTYYGFDREFTVNFLDRDASVISFKENPTVKIQYNDDLSINLEKLYAAIWENVVADTTPADLNTANVSIKYYAEAKTGSLGDLGHAWADLNGEKISSLTYPAISEGTWKLRFEFAGNADYKGFSEEVDVVFTGRDPAFELKENAEGMEIGLVFKSATEYDYDATAAAIREALVTKLGTIDLSEVKVQYKPLGSKVADLDYQPTEILGQDVGKAFGEGEFTIVLTWGGDKGTAQYKPFSEEVKVNMVDNRTPSKVVLVDTANITYNMDANVMIEEIIKNAIDSANSTLPDSYEASDFTVKYYNADEDKWLPIEGGKLEFIGIELKDYPHMNAGDGQQIQITFNGSKDYKPSDTAEGTLNVAKANVKVNVKKLITMHAGDADLPEGSITLDPNDPEIDRYTIFAGVTSKIGGKVTTSVYLDLPDRFTDEGFLKIADPIFKGVYGKTLTEIMNDGITVGELKDLAAKLESVADKLGKLGFDVESFKQVMSLIANLPSIVDDMTIAIGTPSHAGIYQAFAVTNSINYNTAFGTGTVLVLKNFTGIEIVKNDKLDDGKLTVSEAQAILDGNDQLCTLKKDGKELSKTAQSALHYRFTGINGGKFCSSHDMPVDPGKYIVTASVRGGDYYAFPKTFTFTVVADPTPEVTPEA